MAGLDPAVRGLDPAGNKFRRECPGPRPGGNITGLSTTSVELSGKRLQLIREMIPTVQRLAILANAADPITTSYIAEIERAAPGLGLQTEPIMVSAAHEFEAAFAAMARTRADAVITQSSLPAPPAVALALKYRLPLFSTNRIPVDAGALMSYAGRFDDAYREAAVYVDKILRGAKPADLPVQEPTR